MIVVKALQTRVFATIFSFNQIKKINFKMKTKLLNLLAIIGFSVCVFAQTTAGTLTFSYLQPKPTTPAPSATNAKNAFAVWIENSAGTLIKTKIKYVGAGMGTSDHLPSWATKAGCITTANAGGFLDATDPSCAVSTDAVTGATRSTTTVGTNIPPAFGQTVSVTWDGKDNAGTVVPDGNYTIFIESSWQGALADGAHNAIVSYTFAKGTTTVDNTTTPPTGTGDTTYFTNVSLLWSPSTMGTTEVNGKNSPKFYPNPVTDYFRIQGIDNVTGVRIYDVSGKLLRYLPKAELYNIEELPTGLYFVEVITKGKSYYDELLKK